MGVLKKKTEENTDLKRKRAFKQNASAMNKADQSILDTSSTLEFWKNEISDLESQNFASAEKAINALINKVISKMDLKSSNAEETRSFLLALFETDPEIQEELLSILK